MRRARDTFVATGATWLFACVIATAATPDKQTPEQAIARQILRETGVQGGLIVHLGCGNGRLTAALCANERYLVHGLDADAQRVTQAREHIQSLGLYGKVSVDRCSGSRLPYIDNLVSLLVVEDAGLIPPDELQRVLAPRGVAYVKAAGRWTKLVKPRPKEMDEWNHYLHDADNNAVAHDALVGPPRHLQWVCGPDWSRHHDHMASLSALVSAAGRVFYIMDEGRRESILLPAQWSLVARDAFSGTLLWKRPIAEWNTHLWPLKSGPNQLPRRLVAVDDRVYVTLGIDAPLTALDAATGQTVRTYTDTEHTDEVLASEGTLFLLVAQGPNRWKEYRPQSSYVWQNPKTANSRWAWDEAPRWVMAVRADTGAALWKQQCRVAPLTLAADPQRVCFYDGERVVCLKRATGERLWASEPVPLRHKFPTGYGPTLVVQPDVVLLSVEGASMMAFAAADGQKLWQSEHHHGGHNSPDDLLVIDGLAWSGAIAGWHDNGVFTGRDVRTGAVQSEFLPDVATTWFHHRCYRSRATDRYVLSSWTGIELIDVKARHWDFNHWVRGGCLYGIMPCNGLIYAPPHSCGCFLESKLCGLNALAAESPSRLLSREVPESDRLKRGPAFHDDAVRAGEAASGANLSADWPTYRHDAARSGSVKAAVPAELRRAWQVELGGKLTSPVVADGKVFLAAVDSHTLHALDAASGRAAWRYTAGGRIDSPPTIDSGRALFGSADGHVYCLRASDGQLLWRYRAAPADRRLVAYDQVESAWPVSGSVLVFEGTVYCVAGRSAFLDGGMRLLRLDAATGRKLSETLIDDRDPETGNNLQSRMKAQDLPVALPDILSRDGRSVYMRAQAFDLAGVRRNIAPLRIDGELLGEGVHLFSRTGFLDDSWFWRSYWMYGKAVDSNYSGWLRPGHLAPTGRLMVFDEAGLYGFDRKPEYLCNASVAEYYLYGADREVRPEAIRRVQAAIPRIDAAAPNGRSTTSDWATRKKFPMTDQNPAGYQWAKGNLPIQTRALVLAGRTLFLAGPPAVVDEAAAFAKPDDPAIRAKLAEQVAAFEGRRGGQLLAASAVDGRKLAAYELGAMPAFDGMAAAHGKLYLTTVDGKVLCLGSEGTPLAEAPAAEWAALDTGVRPPPDPSAALDGDFAHVARARVTGSDLGYHLHTADKTLGLALKKLATPAKQRFELRFQLRPAADGRLKNGFLLLGETAEEARLLKCGVLWADNQTLMVVGPLRGGKPATQPVTLDAAKVHDVSVTCDLWSGELMLKIGQDRATAKLEHPPATISYVGYGAVDAGVDFSPVQVMEMYYPGD